MIPASRAKILPNGPEIDDEDEHLAAAAVNEADQEEDDGDEDVSLRTSRVNRSGNRRLTREPNRTPARASNRKVEAVGRDGEVLTRRRTQLGDRYAIPTAEIPEGWSYQWNQVTVLNKEVHGDLVMAANGWRPVPASRHPGRWMPADHKGAIIVDGLRLEERPLVLTESAQAEDRMRAKAQIRDQTDSLRLTQKELPGSREARYRKQGGGMRMEIDPGLDIPLPQHQLARD